MEWLKWALVVMYNSWIALMKKSLGRFWGWLFNLILFEALKYVMEFDDRSYFYSTLSVSWEIFRYLPWFDLCSLHLPFQEALTVFSTTWWKLNIGFASTRVSFIAGLHTEEWTILLLIGTDYSICSAMLS
jgi:hypothetical protein